MTTAVDLNELYDASYRRLVVQIYAVCGDLAAAEWEHPGHTKFMDPE